MILAFDPQFVPKILNGTKIHTFRHGNRWKPGDLIQMATGYRSKEYNQFNTDIPQLQTCTSVQKVTVQVYTKETDILYKISITIDDHMLLQDHIFLFAWNDGFESLADFYDWFLKNGTEIHPGIFESKGQIIHWTFQKY